MSHVIRTYLCTCLSVARKLSYSFYITQSPVLMAKRSAINDGTRSISLAELRNSRDKIERLVPLN
jgi:hypothetical protein